MNTPLHEIVSQRHLVCDGAMGTQLMLAGLAQGECGERWNLLHPDRVFGIQHRYVDAGADCLITNTFGAHRIGLARHEREKPAALLSRDVSSLNRAGARLAREAFTFRSGFVLGDIGPLGVLLEPYGDLTVTEARSVLEEQAAALVGGGVDAIIVETQASLEELGLAIAAARAAGARSIIGSLAYDRTPDGSYRTMMGVAPDTAAAFVERSGGHIIALNCGTGMDMAAATEVAQIYRQHCGLPVMIQPNAGQPVLEGARLVYRQSPTDMAAAVGEALDAGVSIIGSCCGSTPDHTRAIRAALDRWLSAKAETVGGAFVT